MPGFGQAGSLTDRIGGETPSLHDRNLLPSELPPSSEDPVLLELHSLRSRHTLVRPGAVEPGIRVEHDGLHRLAIHHLALGVLRNGWAAAALPDRGHHISALAVADHHDLGIRALLLGQEPHPRQFALADVAAVGVEAGGSDCLGGILGRVRRDDHIVLCLREPEIGLDVLPGPPCAAAHSVAELDLLSVLVGAASGQDHHRGADRDTVSDVVLAGDDLDRSHGSGSVLLVVEGVFPHDRGAGSVEFPDLLPVEQNPVRGIGVALGGDLPPALRGPRCCLEFGLRRLLGRGETSGAGVQAKCHESEAGDHENKAHKTTNHEDDDPDKCGQHQQRQQYFSHAHPRMEPRCARPDQD